MRQKQIFISDFAYLRLRDFLKNANGNLSSEERDSRTELMEILKNAVIMRAGDFPYNVVSMNSRIFLTDLISKEKIVADLVYPRDTRTSRHKVSILSPFGISLLGSEVRKIINNESSDRRRLLKIENLLHQPEADHKRRLLMNASPDRMDRPLEDKDAVFFG